MFRRRFVRAVGLMTLAVGFAAAQEPDPKPAAVPDGVIASSFRAFVVSDERFEKGSPRNRVDKMHDLVVDNALNPVVAVFSRQEAMPNGTTPNAAVAQLTAKLNDLVQDKELKAARLGAFVSFLTLGKEYPEAEGRDPARKNVQTFAAEVKKLAKPGTPAATALAVPLTLAASKSDAVTAWDVKETDALTVVFYREMKPLQRWAYPADKLPTDDDVKAIAAAVEKELRAKK